MSGPVHRLRAKERVEAGSWPKAPKRVGTTGVLDASIAILIGAVTYVVYRWAVGPAELHQSGEPHFVLLADALLHGHLWVDPVRAVRLGDITPFAGRFYVSFPPMPAILLLPFVAWSGPDFDDRLFSIVLGSVNVALAYLLARRLSFAGFAGPGVPVGRTEAIAVAALLGIGTVHFYSALEGTVWFIAHVVSVTFTLLYLLECFGAGRPIVAGGLLAVAFLTRTTVVFGLVFWVILALRRAGNPRDLLWPAIRFAIPLAIAVVILLGQNVIRFGSPFDFGYLSMRVARQLEPDLLQYGQFSSHFVPRNLAALVLTAPIVAPINPSTWLGTIGGPAGLLRQFMVPSGPSAGPFPVTFDPWGAGLWAVSPALGFSLRPPDRRLALTYAAAWLSTLAIAAPDLLYYNTGWVQYGYRFAQDFIPFLLVLTAIGLRRPIQPAWRALFVLLLVISVGSNVLGARWFLGQPPYLRPTE